MGKIKIEMVSMRVARIKPAPDWIKHALEHAELELRFENGQSRWVRHTRRAFKREGQWLYVPAGSVPRLVDLLRAKGYRDIVVNDRRRFVGRQFKVANSYLASLAGGPRELADAVVSHPGGLITGKDGAECLAQILVVLRTFPNARTVVAVATCDVRGVLVQQLKKTVVEEVAEVRSPHLVVGGARISVCSYRALATSFPDASDMILLPNVQQAVNCDALAGLEALDRHKIFGFVPENYSLDPRSTLFTELLVGPVLYRPEGHRRCRGRVEFCTSAAPALRLPSDPLLRKREGTWHNERRNRLVALIASACALGRPEPLWREGLLLNQDALQRRLVGAYAIRVVVESPEHGRALLHHLPGWKLVTAETASWNGVTLPNSDAVGTIVTLGAASKLRGFPADVVVVAHGTRIEADLYPHGSVWAETGGELLVIDIADDFDQIAVDAARRRLEAYRMADFRVIAPAWLVDATNPDTMSV